MGGRFLDALTTCIKKYKDTCVLFREKNRIHNEYIKDAPRL